MTTEQRTNLLGMSQPNLESFFESLGERSFRAAQVSKWIHQSHISDFLDMTNLSFSLRQRLADVAEVRAPETLSRRESADGTIKWLLRVDDKNSIETVFIPEAERGTLCISSQAGCPLDCSFCATAKQGFSRNLTSAEVIGQLWLVTKELAARTESDTKVTNVVMMGMGEPLLNFEAVTEAMTLMLADHGYGLARRRVTLSTAGLVPGILRLKEHCPVSLAVSLHAPNDLLRDELVPLNRSFPIAELLAACRTYVAGSAKAIITFEYVMLDGVNDSEAHARSLVHLIRDLPAKVNLIPFNSFPGISYRRSPPEVIDKFREILIKAGLVTVTRKTRGDDIEAACGQLAGAVTPRSKRILKRRGLAAPVA
jgi:23S rRNA (adenine2503-C2)-methyltransferase